MKSKPILILVFLIFTAAKTFAGWYEVYNFTGFIDKYPVTLSFQVYDGYFGEPEKKHYNIIGVYKYNKFNNPIRLVGEFDQNTYQLEIYELDADENITATFSLDFIKNELNGTWKSGNKELQVNLKLKSKLSDSGEEEFRNIEILQSNSLKDFYFVGIYSKQSESQDAYMNALRIFNKKTNQLLQTLGFEEVETPTGNVMTIIYDSVTTDETNDFIISNDIGRMGGYLLVAYNPKKNLFFLDPVPIIEGIDPDE